MESNKLENKIRDWATNFGFTLPDGSAPPADHFALLIATPHRRQLWEVLVDSVQPRQKIEHKRKQILAAKLQNVKRYSKTGISKHVTDRLDLWKKQNIFEADVKEKRNSAIKLEKSITAKLSDSVFEICKLSELEKQLEEINEKSLILKLLTKRKQKMVEEIQKKLIKVNPISYLCDHSEKSKEEEYLEVIKKKLIKAEDSDCLMSNCHDCALIREIEEFCKSGRKHQSLWEDVMKLKEISINEFSRFLEDLNLNEKNTLCQSELEAEKNLMLSISQLKQKTTEKSLQVIISSTEGKLLDFEIQNLEDKFVRKGLHEGSLSDTFSFFISDGKSIEGEFNEDSEKTVKNFKNYINLVGLQSYQEFLKEELKELEKEIMKIKQSDGACQELKDTEYGQTLKTYESVVEEINSINSEEKEIVKEIFCQYDLLQSLLRSLKEEIKTTSNVEEFASKLKFACEKQVSLLLDTPLNAFKTIESSSGRILFECESASHCLNYPGKFKQFFSAMIIPPLNDVQKISLEIENRKRILSEIRKFMSERNKLTDTQKKIHHKLNSIKYDSQLCEKNFKESDGILWSIFFKTDELFREVDFIENILKNWVEQPYGSLIAGNFGEKC